MERTMYRIIGRLMFLMLMLALALPVAAHDEGEHIHDDEGDAEAEFDIVFAQVAKIGSNLIFQIVVDGEAGSVIPEATGEVAGAEVLSYVWPTSLDTAVVGFEPEQGI